MGTQKTLRGQKYADRLGPVVRVGTDLFQSDFATLQQGLDELGTKGGGTLVIGTGTFSLIATLTFPAFPVNFVGQGRGATILDIGANVIDLFTIPSDEAYSFSDFSARAGNLVGQRCFRRSIAASDLTKKTIVERVEMGGLVIGDSFDEIFSNSVSGRYIVSDCSLRTRAAGTPRIWDGSGSLEVKNCSHSGLGDIIGDPVITFSDLVNFEVGAAMDLGAESSIDNCALQGSVAGGFTDTIVTTVGDLRVTASELEPFAFDLTAGVGVGSFIGNRRLAATSSARVIDSGATQPIVAVGNTFVGGTSEAIRLASVTGSNIGNNRGCKVTEIGATDNNRYSNNGGFEASTIIGPSSVVDGAKAGKYTGDGSVSQAITLGFRPRYLRIWREELVDGDGTVVFETTTDIVADNAAGGAIFIDNNDLDFETNRIISLDAAGFTVDDDGADDDPNATGVVYNFWAVE